MSQQENSGWWVYKGDGQIHDEDYKRLENTNPPWRLFGANYEDQNALPSSRKLARDKKRGQTFFLDPSDADDQKVIDLVNSALYLRRPLLITGETGIGKSSVAYGVAYELNLGSVLEWPIISHSTIKEGLYEYDPLERMREITKKVPQTGHDEQNQPEKPDIGIFFRLKQIGTAFVNTEAKPRVVLIDELDKSDMDLPNNLLNIIEEGEFTIPELARLGDDTSVNIFKMGDNERVSISGGVVRCRTFPFIIMTSNAEREFPRPFLRRCIRLELKKPEKPKLEKIVERQFKTSVNVSNSDIQKLINDFIEIRNKAPLATDQLLNAIHLYLHQVKHGNGKGNLDKIVQDMYKPL